jgi:hypothetical protein
VTLTMTCQWYMPLSRIGQVIVQLFKMPMQVVVGLAVRFSVQLPGPRFSRPRRGRAGRAACCLPAVAVLAWVPTTQRAGCQCRFTLSAYADSESAESLACAQPASDTEGPPVARGGTLPGISIISRPSRARAGRAGPL